MLKEKSQTVRLIAIFALVVVAWDAAASLLSLMTTVPYGWSVVVSTPIYLFLGYRVVLRHSTLSAFSVGILVALVDATLGWAIAWWIGPGRPRGHHPPWIHVFAGLFAVLLCASFAGLGGFVARKLASRRRARQEVEAASH